MDPNISDLFVAQPIARLLLNKYVENYGTFTCGNIQQQNFGRIFYLEDPQEFQKLEDAGGHSDSQKAPRIVGNAAKWALEVLLEKGAVEIG
jgi:hypothetical protein